jgi:exosortase
LKLKIANGKVLLVWGVPVVFLWLGLIRHLSVEWTLNPRYGYGWAVPVLCGFLVWQDLVWQRREGQSDGGKLADLLNRRTALAGVMLAFGYGPLRLIQEANPDWRLVSWGLAFDVLGLTLLLVSWLIQFCQNRNSADFLPSSLFPFLFFLTAVPWPTFIESTVVKALTQFVTFGTSEALEMMGIPCLVQGNVVEVAAGRIGIEEGCSGIRSFQSALMVSLFFGQVYELRLLGRFVCIFAAGSLAVLLNLIRAIVLTLLAAERGSVLVKRWHELAGIPILVGLFVGVWLVALILRWKRLAREPASLKVENSHAAGRSASMRCAWVSSLWVPAGLLVWLGIVEVVTKEWYGNHERDFSSTTTWRVEPPRSQDDFRELSFSADARRFLRFEEGSNTRWLTDDGMVCQAIFLSWKRGGAAPHLARSHTPEECLAAGGYGLIGNVRILTTCVKGLELKFRAYVAREMMEPVYVFYCLWEDGVGCFVGEPAWLTYRNRLESVLAGRLTAGQCSLEIVIWGAASEEAARNAFEEALNQIVRVSD